MQTTSLPLSAKQVPVTRPTYPVPTTATFIAGRSPPRGRAGFRTGARTGPRDWRSDYPRRSLPLTSPRTGRAGASLRGFLDLRVGGSRAARRLLRDQCRAVLVALSLERIHI